jgi:hypothetical protein
MSTLVAPGGVVNAADVNEAYDDAGNKQIGRALASGTQSFTHNITSAVALGAEDYDTANYHDIVTNNSRITPTKSGYYRFNGTVIFGARTDYQVTDAWFRKNGATNIPPGGRRSSTTGQVNSFQAAHADVTIFMDATAFDYIEFVAVQTNVAAAAQVTAFAAQHISTVEWQFERDA